MPKLTKYKQLTNQASNDPELERLNGFLNRLERIERDVKGLILEIDQMRMEKEHAFRNRLAAGEKV